MHTHAIEMKNDVTSHNKTMMTTLHSSSLKKIGPQRYKNEQRHGTIKHTLKNIHTMTVRLLVLNAPLVFCHGMDNEVCLIPMSRRTTMSFAVLWTVALANQSLEDPVPTLLWLEQLLHLSHYYWGVSSTAV